MDQAPHAHTMQDECARLLTLADAIEAAVPDDARAFLQPWRGRVRAWMTNPMLETLQGERALEDLALELRYRWLRFAHGLSDRYLMSPLRRTQKYLPVANARIRYPYDRWLKPAYLEDRLAEHRPTPSGWLAEPMAFAGGMSAITTWLQYHRTAAGRLWNRPRDAITLHWLGGYFEVTRMLEVLCDATFRARHHAHQSTLPGVIRKGRADIYLIEPVSADAGLDVFDLDAFADAWRAARADAPFEHPVAVMVDTSFTGHAFTMDRLCAALAPYPPDLVVHVSSGLKLDQAGLELANAGLMTLYMPDTPDNHDRIARYTKGLRRARTTLGATLTQDEYAALSAPFFLDGRTMPAHAEAVFANAAAFANALATAIRPDGGGLITRVTHPELGDGAAPPWARSPVAFVHYAGETEDDRDDLERVLEYEARARGLTFAGGSSFGFRGHRFEMGVDPAIANTALRVAAGSRAGPSLDGTIKLFQDLAAYSDFAALRAAYRNILSKDDA